MPVGGATALSELAAHRQVVYRLLPRKRVIWRWLERTLEDQRRLYNAALEERIDCHRKTGKGLSYFDQCKSLTVCRQALGDMSAMSVMIQRGTLKRLDEAFKGFFRRGGGFPRFQGRHHWNSISIVSGVKVEADRIRIPSFGWLTIRRRGGNPHVDGTAKSAVLKRVEGRWYVVVCYAISLPEPVDDGRVVGVDMNAGQVATSDGVIHHAPDMAKLEARKRRYQRKVSRCKRGSKRRALAKTARRIACKRHDWQHKTSRTIADAAHTVVVEDLKPRAMTRSAKGTAGEPGRNVKQKAGLNRVILDPGWSDLRRMLSWKAGRLIAVDPRHTSQTCAACGVVDARSRRTQAAFMCVSCGHADNADINASREIRRRGLAQLHGEGVAVRHPVNREDIPRLAA